MEPRKSADRENMNNTDARMRKTVLFSMILVPVIPFALVILVGYFYSAFTIEARTVESLQRIVNDHRQMIDTFLRERRTNLEFVINTNSFESLSRPHNLAFVYDNLRGISNAFVDLGVFNEEGLHVAYHGPHQLSGKIYKDEPWFMEVIQNGVHISDVFLGFRGYPHFIIAVARKENGKIWVLRATIDTYIFNDMVGRIRIGKSGEAYIINKDGIFQTAPFAGEFLLQQDPNRALYLRRHEGIKTFIGNQNFIGISLPYMPGDIYLYATTWLEEKPWLMVVRQEKQDAFRNLRFAMYLIAVIAIAGLAAIIGLAFQQTGRVVRRIKRMDAEKKGLENQLIRATRLAELGQMAAGFAHEINNPLQVIRSEQALMEFIITEIKEMQENADESSFAELEDSIHQMTIQINRCAHITQAILNFGRYTEPDMENIRLSDFVGEIIVMISRKAAVHGISVNQRIADDTPLIYGDKGQLQQVLLNLLNNAIDAVIEKHGSKEGEVLIYAGRTEDGHVEVSVQDNGAGISAENFDKIFTPFFTTKPPGKGTGLGLSVCYGIVENLGGKMSVSSHEDVGTTFTIWFPAAENKSAQ